MPSSEVFKKYKAGTLHSGSARGPKVTNPKQAVAIMESEKRAENANGGTYPEHGSRGKVSAINEHHSSSKHVMVEVTHGKRKRSKGPKGEPGELNGYDRPTSRVAISRSDAANYPIGKKVRVGLSPIDDEDAEDNGDDEAAEGEGQNQSMPAPKKSAGKAAKAPKAKAAPPAKRSGPRPILQAMTRRAGK